MGQSVRIPTILRSYTAGEAVVPASGATAREVIDDLDRRYPGLRGRVLDETGQLRRFLNVYVDDDDIRFLDHLDTLVPPAAVVSIIPSVAGGQADCVDPWTP